MPAEWCGEAEHQTEDDSRDGQDDEHDALQRQDAEDERADVESQTEEQPGEEAEDLAAVHSLRLGHCLGAHPGFASS
jgi:hypothetical protein